MVIPHVVRRSLFVRFVATVLVFFSLPNIRSELIYDNTSQYNGQFFNERGEYGDQVDLEGTARRLTQVLFEYFGRFEPDGDEQVKLRIYQNEKPYDRFRKEPTTLLYESDWNAVRPGFNTQLISGLNVQLPFQTVTVTVEFRGIGEDEAAGLLFYDPPTVGYSFNEVWLKGASRRWVPILYSTTEPEKRASVGMRLIAEPEPLLDQRNTVAEFQLPMRDGTNRVRFAQTFSPEISGRLNHFVLAMQFTNSPVRVNILDTIGNAPGTTILGAVNMIRGTGTPQTNYFLDQAIYLKAETLYAIEMSTAAGDSAIPSHLLPVSRNTYGRGHLWFRDEARGGLWTPATENGDTYLDAKFEAHVVRAEPAAQLLSPLPNRIFDLTEPILLQAQHRPPEIGAIARVRFVAGTNELASLTNAPYSFVWTNAPPGDLFLRAIAEDTFRRPFRSDAVPITVRPAGPPANDNFAQRLPIAGTAARAVKPAASATLQTGEPRPADGYGGKTLWWSWTAYDNSPVTISAQNTPGADASVAVYRGNSLTNLVLLTNGIPQVQFTPEAGINYAIVVEPRTTADLVTLDLAAADIRVRQVSPSQLRAGDIATVALTRSNARSITNVQLLAGSLLLRNLNSSPQTLSVGFSTNGFFDLVAIARDTRGIQTISAPFRVVVRPGNDSLLNVFPLSGFSGSTTFSSLAATGEATDPATFETSDHSIWFSWQAPADGICRVSIPSREAGGLLGAYIVRTNASGLSIESVAVGSSAQTNEIAFFAKTGSTYYFLIAADRPETGRLTFELRPANDAFAHRGHLKGESAGALFRFARGTLEGAELSVASNSTNLGSVWWSWTAPANGPARLAVTPATAVEQLAAFAGADLNSLTLLNQSTNSGSLEFSAQERNVYHIRLVGRATNTAPVRLAISMATLRLVRPVNNQIFESPARILLERVFFPGASPGEVEFTANGAVITNLHVADGSVFWTNPPPGRFELRARSLNDPALLSAPVTILVATNRAAFPNKIFAGPFARTSFVLSESGELNVFGARPTAIERVEHEDLFHPAVLLSFARHEPWRSIQANSAAYLGLTESGALSTISDEDILVGGPDAWLQIAAGGTAYAAIANDGELYVSGLGGIQRPASVSRWQQVRASGEWILALADNGEVYVINRQNAAILGHIERPAAVTQWTKLDAGAESALLFGSNGAIYSFDLLAPVSLDASALSPRNRPTGVRAWSDFAAGGHHQLFLDDQGVLYASGRNIEGQLGIGRLSSSEGLVRVPFPSGLSRWTQIAAGEFHTLAIGDDCRVYAWGSNAGGQLGLGRHIFTQNRPAPVEALGALCSPPVRISRIEILPDGEFALQFDTFLNRPAYVEYSDDLITWHRAPDEVVGDGQDAYWIDTGPPVTIRHPAESATRFYRVVRE